MIPQSPDEVKVLITSFKSLSLVGDLVDRVSWWTMGAAGAIAGTIVANLTDLVTLLTLNVLRYCLVSLATSFVMGCLAFYFSILRKTSYLSTEKIFEECGDIETFSPERFICIFFNKMPFFIRPGRWIASWVANKANLIPFELAAFFSAWQSMFVVFQVLFLIGSLFIVMFNL